MAMMSFMDMLHEAGYADFNHFRQLVGGQKRVRLAELIQKHGLDFKGFKSEIEANTQESVKQGTLTDFFYDFGKYIKPSSLEATPEEVKDIFVDSKYMPSRWIPLFENVTPEHIANIRWPLSFDEQDRERFSNIMKRPEFQKVVIGNIAKISNWDKAISTIPNLSREDAEFVSQSHPYNVIGAVLQGGMPKELIKTVIRKNAGTTNMPAQTRTDFPKAASEMMDDPSESPEVKNYIGLLALMQSTSGNTHMYGSSGATEKDFRPILHKVPPSELPSIIDRATMRGASARGMSYLDEISSSITGRLNENEMPPEHEAAVDEWARKKPSTTIARFINTGRFDKLSPDEMEKAFDFYTINKNRYSGHGVPDREMMTAGLSILPKELIDRMMQGYADKPEVLGSLGMWKYINRYGEQPSNQELQDQAETLPGFFTNKLNVDYAMRKNGSTTSFMTGEDLEKLALNTMSSRKAMQILAHPNVTPEAVGWLRDRMDSGYLDSDSFGSPISGFEALSRANRTDVRVGSTALRHLRDHLDQRIAEGVVSVRPEELPKGRTFNTLTRAVTDKKGNVQHVLDWNPLRDNRAGGNITSAKVSEAIDSMPVLPIMVDNSNTWGGAQRHSEKTANHVLQFMPSPEVVQQFKDKGLYTAFGEMSLDHMADGTSHPTGPFHLGWARYSIDHNKKEIFIDEIQSDLHSSFRRLMKAPKNKLKSQMQSVVDTIFGKHHPSEVLHEAAHQFFRDQGHEGYKVHIHSLKSKAHISLDESREAPAHFKEGYEAIPKKMGYTPAKYGDLSIETGDGDRKAGGLKGMPTHGSKIVKFEELLFELAKGEW